MEFLYTRVEYKTTPRAATKTFRTLLIYVHCTFIYNIYVKSEYHKNVGLGIAQVRCGGAAVAYIKKYLPSSQADCVRDGKKLHITVLYMYIIKISFYLDMKAQASETELTRVDGRNIYGKVPMLLKCDL